MNRQLCFELVFLMCAVVVTARVLVWQSEKLYEQVERHCVYAIFAEEGR